MSALSIERGQRALDAITHATKCPECAAPLPENATHCLMCGWAASINNWEPLKSIKPDTYRAPYPIDLFPLAMQAAIDEVQAATQAPIALVAQAGLAALAVAGQGLVSVARDDTLRSPVSLYMQVIARSGERKTAADAHFMQAVREWQSREIERLKPELDAFTSELDAWKSARAGLLDAIKGAARNGESIDELETQLKAHDADRPEPVRVPRLIYADITTEQLIYLLAKQWPSAIESSSEAGTIFGSHGTNADNVMKYFAARNVLWDGGEYTTDRRTTDSVSANGVRLSASLSVQRQAFDVFNERTGGLARGMGTWARYLLCEPESTQGTRFYREPSANMPKRAAFHRRITQLLDKKISINPTGGIDTSLLKFSREGQAVWIEHYDAVEAELRAGGEFDGVRDVASKTADNGARLAALFHTFEHGDIGEISAAHVRAGCLLAIWYLGEAKRILFADEGSSAHAGKLETYLVQEAIKSGTNSMSRRQVMQLGPYALRKKSALNDAAAALEAAGRIRVNEGSFEIHPDILAAQKPQQPKPWN